MIRLAFILLAAMSAVAQVTVGADLGTKSQYVSRGTAFDEHAVIWPDAWVNWNGFTESEEFFKLKSYMSYTKVYTFV